MGYSLSGVQLPLTIAAGKTQNVTISFSPQTSGAASGSVSFVSNATNSPATVSLSGSGTVPVQHSVDLSWNASTSSVSGYNIYRGTVSGGPYTKLNSSAQSGTTFVDSTVQSGKTYYYVVTAVSSSGTESSYSNQATAVVPSP
jgi:fibronectin type 3 domain-containing protein